MCAAPAITGGTNKKRKGAEMVATTDQKGRLFDLICAVGELVRDGKRDPDAVATLLQFIKDGDVANVSASVAASKLLRRIETFLAGSVVPRKRHTVRDLFSMQSEAVKFAWIDPDFLAEFGDMEIVERSGYEMACDELLKNSVDGPIRAELPANHLVDLMALWNLLLGQPRATEDGRLLVNGFANIFYMPNKGGVARAVSARRSGDGWRVNSYSVERRYEWAQGYRVFSRNSIA